MSDKIREIQDKMRNIHGSDDYIAAVAYIPLFGWIFPYFAKKDDPLCQFHGKQAMQLNLVILIVYFFVWLLEHFPILSWLFAEGQLLHPVTRSMWLISAAIYVGLSIFCAFKALSDEQWEIPKLNEYVNKVLDNIRNTTSLSGKAEDGRE